MLEGTNLIVATGSVPRSIPGWEIDGNRIVSSDHALDWPTRPDRVVIVGAGVIGCEFASLLVDLGSEYRLGVGWTRSSPAPTLTRRLQKLLSRRGSVFARCLGGGVQVVEVVGDGHRRDVWVEADVALMAVGRGRSPKGSGSTRLGSPPTEGS